MSDRLTEPAVVTGRPRSLAGDAWHDLRRSRVFWIASGLIVVVLLLVIGSVLAVPRRHERTVLLIATMLTIVAALTTTAVPLWITTGPGTVQRDWIGVLEVPEVRAAVVTLAVLVPIVGAGLVRPGRIAWAVIACISCYAAYAVVLVGTSSTFPFYPDELAQSPALPTTWGAGVNGLFILVAFLPMIAVTRVVCADRAAARRARRPALVPDDPLPVR